MGRTKKVTKRGRPAGTKNKLRVANGAVDLRPVEPYDLDCKVEYAAFIDLENRVKELEDQMRRATKALKLMTELIAGN